MSQDSWAKSLEHLRSCADQPLALMNALVLARMSSTWHESVVARTSHTDLLFTLPGDEGYPFRQSVTVKAVDLETALIRWEGEHSYEERPASTGQVAGFLDAFLRRMTSPLLTCVACGGRVKVSAKWFDVFERMHFTCFHYEFEHRPFDRDEECLSAGCPSAAVDPWHVTDDPRDALVAQLLADLRSSTLASESSAAQVEREGPGVIAARFDEDRYLVTVRRVPESRR